MLGTFDGRVKAGPQGDNRQDGGGTGQPAVIG